MIKKLLVANRGEIAVRILQAARELGLHTVALSTPDDDAHCTLGHPDETLPLPSPSAYLDIALLLQLCHDHAIDTIHPGYGFLSESPDFARRMHEHGVTVIGPGWSILSRTGDKLQAKQLAAASGVPVLESRSCTSTAEIRAFIAQVGYPVMIKAVDGGGGRGIRLVRAHQAPELESLVARARAESPSGTVFVEKAAVDGFHHVEVQVVGDGRGGVRHLWERDCSLQRRFQKIVEVAPGLLERATLREVVRAALRIARDIRYRSLGTFEFLVSEGAAGGASGGEFYFLEINPRLQVEHTITEQLTGVDLVQTQLRLARGESLESMGIEEMGPETAPPPRTHSIQLRLCAEDPRANFALSIGKVTDFFVPPGAGVRVDTHLAPPVVVGSHFDNLLAKIIVTAGSWEAAVRRARRVLHETRIAGVKTNLDLLRGIVAHRDFLHGRWDTLWLERNLPAILESGEAISATAAAAHPAATPTALLQSLQASSSVLFRRGDAWAITLAPKDQHQPREEAQHHLRLARVLRNDFPAELVAEIEYTTPAASTTYRVQLASTNTSATALVSSRRRGDASNPRHIVLPLSGKLIEVLVRAGEDVSKDQVVAFVKQMKMELEVRSPRAGRVKWAYELDEGEEEDVAEGVLLAELEEEVVEKGKL